MKKIALIFSVITILVCVLSSCGTLPEGTVTYDEVLAIYGIAGATVRGYDSPAKVSGVKVDRYVLVLFNDTVSAFFYFRNEKDAETFMKDRAEELEAAEADKKEEGKEDEVFKYSFIQDGICVIQYEKGKDVALTPYFEFREDKTGEKSTLTSTETTAVEG